MRNKIPLVLVLLVSALSLGAWRHGGHHGRGIDKIAQRLTADLNLDADQKVKLDAVLAAFKEARRQSRDARRAERESLADLVAAKDLDTAKISAVLDGRHAAMEKARPHILAKLADFHKSLNDDQRKTLAEKLKKLGRRHSKGE